MIQDFKGHHFVEDTKPGEPPGLHHCDRGLKAWLRPDGSVFFDIERTTSKQLMGLPDGTGRDSRARDR